MESTDFCNSDPCSMLSESVGCILCWPTTSAESFMRVLGSGAGESPRITPCLDANLICESYTRRVFMDEGWGLKEMKVGV